jgi:hypothetical protein
MVSPSPAVATCEKTSICAHATLKDAPLRVVGDLLAVCVTLIHPGRAAVACCSARCGRRLAQAVTLQGYTESIGAEAVVVLQGSNTSPHLLTLDRCTYIQEHFYVGPLRGVDPAPCPVDRPFVWKLQNKPLQHTAKSVNLQCAVLIINLRITFALHIPIFSFWSTSGPVGGPLSHLLCSINLLGDLTCAIIQWPEYATVRT